MMIPVLIFQVIIFLLLNFRCGKQSKFKEVNEKVFVQVYCDVITYADIVEPKQREAFVDSVLNSYQINREEFRYTIDAYSRDEKKWEKIFTQIVEELERREKESGAKIDSSKLIKPDLNRPARKRIEEF